MNTDIGLLIFDASFKYPEGEFQVMNSKSIKTKWGVDDEIYKKLYTDTLTKALSMLGFNADVFMNTFQDARYENEAPPKRKPQVILRVASVNQMNFILQLLHKHGRSVDAAEIYLGQKFYTNEGAISLSMQSAQQLIDLLKTSKIKTQDEIIHDSIEDTY